MSAKTLDTLITESMESRWAKLRSHKRIISRVKLRLEWKEGAAKRTANAVTVDVSYSGCMAVVGAAVPLRQRVSIVNPDSGRKASAQVVWRDHEAWDVGLELDKPDPSFWGL